MLIRTGLIFFLLLCSNSVMSEDSDRIKALEARIKSLEKQVGKENGLRIKDMKGQTSDTSANQDSRIPASNKKSAITPEQKKKFMNSINAYKKRQKDAQKFLDQLEAEGL